MATKTIPGSIEEWYKGTRSPQDIVQQAYEEAEIFFQKELEDDKSKRQWIEQYTSLDEVLEVVKDARERYANSTSPAGQKAKRWAYKLSEQLLHYSPVLDTISQHHAEYVSLVWGAAKFVLMGVYEHANLFAQISEAMAMIGEALPRMQLHVDLYPTQKTLEGISKLYGHILLFLQKAVKWYNMSPARRVLNAIVKPFDLGYKDTVQQIKLCIESMDTMASAANRAELRGISESQAVQLYKADITIEKLDEMRLDLNAMQRLMAAGEIRFKEILGLLASTHALSSQISVDVTDSRERLCNIEFSHILDSLKPEISAQDQLHISRTIARKRRSWNTSQREAVMMVQRISEWASSEESSILIVQGGPRTEAKIKDLAVDVINLVQGSTSKIIWTLSPNNDQHSTSTIAILKMLIAQLLQEEPGLLLNQSDKINITHFKTNRSEQEWVSLFSFLVSQMPSCFIIIDAENLFRTFQDDLQLVTGFLLLFQQIVDRTVGTGSVIKVLVACYCSSREPIAQLPASNHRLISFVQHSMPLPPKLRRAAIRRKGGLLTGNLRIPDKT